MADLLLSALISVVVRKAGDILFKRIGEMWGINDQRERLENMLKGILALLPDAERQANSNTAVKTWLVNLESAAYDADDLLDEFCYEKLRQDAVRRGHKVSDVSAYFSLKNPALFRYKMSEKLKKVVGKVDGLVVKMGTFGFVHDHNLQVANRNKTDSIVVESKVVGRDKDKEKVVRLLVEGCESADLMVVPIVGMGGLGKTTLAKLVYNDPRVKENFNLPLWVCVSDVFNIGHLVKSIIELVERELNLPIDNMELLQRRLRHVISGKRYILVLDDVWNEDVDEWERLKDLLNCGDTGSAIIVTTRSGKVATIMGTVESYNLECLDEEDSWSLFHKRAFSKGIKECEELVEIGRKMVQNCRGLPLAINTLGSLMSFKSNMREWLAILEESMIWEQNRGKDKVLSVLRLSYDHLPPYMKQCFAFCAVYPKDYEMDKEKLIQFWMANGFIPSDGSGSFEMKGNDIFNELAWRSFFQEVCQVSPNPISWRRDDFDYKGGLYCSETRCKMHDLMHDLAQSIMGTKCLSMSEVPSPFNHPMVDVRHISLRTTPLDINKAIDCFPSTRSLISGLSKYDSHYMENIGFKKSNSLRILELNGWLIEKTIFTPKKMKHLRYLELSVYKITSLPEAITTLYLLQTLRLSRCISLEKLPDGMQYMSSLRHLDIARCFKLRSMPQGLGQLNCLQILTNYIVGTDAGNGIGELKNLNNLHGQLHLNNLRKINAEDAIEANLIAKQNLDDLALCWGMPKYNHPSIDLNIRESNDQHCDFEVLNALRPCSQLKVLHVTLFRGDKLPVWIQIQENLIELYITECRDCKNVPQLEKLPFLRILKLKHLDKVRHLCTSTSTSADDGKDARVTFPSLKKMVLSEMPNICNWCEGEVGNKSSLIFPELKTIVITNCPELTAMPIVPSLINMTVKGNKNLSLFATGLTTLHNLSLESHGGDESLPFQPWESLNNLFLEKYNSIVPVGSNEGEVSITPSKCQQLQLSKVSNVPLSTSLWFWKCFTFLESLEIRECDNLIYWPEQEFRSLNCLREITVSNCSNFLGSQLESPLGRPMTEVLLPVLQYLTIYKCPNLVKIPKCSTQLLHFRIYECSKLQCLPEWLGNTITLKELTIVCCKSLNSLPPSIGVLASLEEFNICDCPNLAYFPEGMEGLKALKVLKIKKCPKIRILPEGLLQRLHGLDELWIEGCPHLERHFRKHGKYQRLISEIRLTKFGEK